MPYILMYSADEKLRSWAEASRPSGVEIIGFRRSPILSPFVIVWHVLTRGRPRGIVFRYLNDYPSLVKTVLRLISEWMVVCLCRLLRIPLAWICHNVDRETLMYHPKITELRRMMIGKAARKIFVTDPGLLVHAKRFLTEFEQKLDYVTFGQPSIKRVQTMEPDLWERLLDFVGRPSTRRIAGTKTLVGLSVGHASDKTVHYEQTTRLLDAAEVLGYEIRLIIIGPIRTYLEKNKPAILRRLREDPRIFLIDKYVLIDENQLAPHVDFYWRAYRDYSVPYGLYHAAKVKKPILAYGDGFLSEAVTQYSLGAVIREDYSNLDQALNSLIQWDEAAACQFLETHTWAEGARRLLRAFDVELG